MDYKELVKTQTWELYEKLLNYLEGQNYYSKIDQFNNFYIGNQWEGLKLSNSVSPVCLNIIKQIISSFTLPTPNSFPARCFRIHHRKHHKICQDRPFCQRG